jgi:hypothetical protein
MEGLFMTFKECDRLKIIQKVCDKRLTQESAAENLGVCTRQVKRLCQKYRLHGPIGLVSKKRGVKSNNYISDEIKEKALSIIKEKYSDFGPTFAHEKLVELHGFATSLTVIRILMIKNNIWTPHKIKEKTIHQMRPRRSREGELVQADGSPDEWFEERAPKCTLLAQVDDATSKIKVAMFADAETTWNYMDLTRAYIEKFGKPLSYYTDKFGVFKVNHPGSLSGNGITQFHRALKELDIELICANSPQAKGRIERANRTLQDRLKKELRLRNISSIEEANAFLPSFIEDYNQRFAKVPKDNSDAHRSLTKENNLNRIFVIKEIRHLSKNLTFQYKNKLYQIKTERPGYALRKAKVTVLENKKEEVFVEYKGKKLSYTIYEERPRQADVISSKELNTKIDHFSNTSKYKPPRSHPWKAYYPRSKFI